MTDRYRMEYVNCEVSEIIDDYEKESLTAEEITDRLNTLTKENKRLYEDNIRVKQLITEAYNHERTQIGRNTLKQLLEQI